MRRHDLISSAILFFIGLFICLYALQFGLGRLGTPGPGLMPFLTGLVICGFSSITFVRAFLNKSSKIEEIWANVKPQKLISTILIMVIYALVLERIGFIICTFFLILILVHYAGSRTWFVSILCGGLSSILSYLLFETWLKAQIPRGIFGF